MSTTDDSFKVVTPDPLTVTEVEDALDGVGELPAEKPVASPHGWTNPGTPPPGK